MFSSNGSAVSPFAQLSSSPFTASSYIHDQYSTNGILFYHHHNPLSIPSVPTNPSITDTQLNMAVSSNYDLMSKLDLHVLNGDQHSPSNFHPRKGPVVKKERHSKKIYTARGLRERRVRLSIQVARKFFDLQDMLGFDKASKTLEWLFKKSRKAIKELAENTSAISLSSSSTCEVVSQNDGPEGIASKTESLPGASGEREMKQAQKSVASLLERESRTRARARARERTRKKMTSRALHESKNCSDWCHHCFTEAPRSLTHQQLACEKSGACCHSMTSSPKVVTHEVEGCTSNNSHHMPEAANAIEGSVVMERKFMKLSTAMHYQQNPEMSKSVTFNFGISDNHTQNMSSLAQIWDINGAVGHSSISAVNDMNLSTELQLYGKLWEAAGKNQCPH